MENAADSLDALSRLPLAVWVRSAEWAYPGLETVHIVAIALVFGTLWLVDLRLLGLLGRIEARPLAATLLPWTLVGFALAAASGSLMFLSQAGDLIANRAFVAKLGLLTLAGLNAGLLHARGPLDPASRLTRVQALLSIVIWLGVILCGRMIAYL